MEITHQDSPEPSTTIFQYTHHCILGLTGLGQSNASQGQTSIFLQTQGPQAVIEYIQGYPDGRHQMPDQRL